MNENKRRSHAKGGRMKINLTPNQANLILQALENESTDDEPKRGEYSYYRCYLDIKKKIEKEQ